MSLLVSSVVETSLALPLSEQAGWVSLCSSTCVISIQVLTMLLAPVNG